MAIKKHVFVSPSGELLPRWKEAFAKAVAAKPNEPGTLSESDIVWLRLAQNISPVEQIQAIRTKASGATLIVLSDTPNDDEAMAVFALSVRGYANSHAGADTLKQIDKVVEQGGLWIGESLMHRLLLGVQNLPRPPSATNTAKTSRDNHFKLTDRELEVAKAIAAGASNKEVARLLNITERTVKAHVSGLFAKLAVTDRLQLALKMRELSR